MTNKPKPQRINFGPIRLLPETVEELRRAATFGVSAASIVRQLVEAWEAARKKARGSK